jgi:NADPH:quinone reductase-like Zn-dependent oxidoreductase
MSPDVRLWGEGIAWVQPCPVCEAKEGSTRMRGVVLGGFDEAPTLSDDLPAHTVGENEVLVRVVASSVNPIDAAIAGGMLRGMAEYDFPVILGRDYAGVVERIGSAVDSFQVGANVFGFLPQANPTVHDGSWCELISVPEDNFIAAAPPLIESSAAGVAPVAGISAIAAIDALGISEGDTVLIVGATGGVGAVASQLAAHAGATVIAPALPEDEDYLSSLGVAEVVDRNVDVVAALRALRPDGVDALLDLVSYTSDALDTYAAILNADGRAASTNGAAGDGPGRVNVMAVPSTENLQRLARLLEDSTITIQIGETYPLADAADALQALATRHTQGKIAVSIA